MDATEDPRVTAVVVTCDQPGNVARLLTDLSEQTTMPEKVIVIDNGIRRPVPSDVNTTELDVNLVSTGENLGPAGGYALGIERALATNPTALWLLDDDISPEPYCLAAQLAELEGAEGHALIWPCLCDLDSGTSADTWGWTAVLVPASFAKYVDPPIAELFYGHEDMDYLIDRPLQLGYRRVRSDNAVAGVALRPGGAWPRWHHYYHARNVVYLHLYRRIHLSRRSRAKRLVSHLRGQWIQAGRSEDRWSRRILAVRGVVDGTLRRLGRRLEPDTTSRPSVQSRHTM